MATKRQAGKRKKPTKPPFINVLQFQILGVEVDVSVGDTLKVAYTVERDGKRYGNTVQAASAAPVDVVAAAFLLASNAADTISAFENEK